VEAGAAVGSCEPRFVKRPAGNVELLVRAVDVGELFESGDDAGDRLADLSRVSQGAPINRRQPPALPGVLDLVGGSP